MKHSGLGFPLEHVELREIVQATETGHFFNLPKELGALLANDRIVYRTNIATLTETAILT